MKDSQPARNVKISGFKYIKESNERFSTVKVPAGKEFLSISRRVMKDSQRVLEGTAGGGKYIKESNERFST